MLNSKKKSLSLYTVILFGSAVFAMHFGASCMIWPVTWGQQSGSSVLLAVTGIMISAIIFPFLAYLAIARGKGSFYILASRINEKFAFIFGGLTVAVLGPLFVIPRMSAASWGAGGVCQNLPRIVGLGRAMELLCSGITIDAAEAYRIGLLNKVVPHDELEKAIYETAAEIRKCSPIAVRIAKETTNACVDIDMNSCLYYEVESITSAFTTEDRREGLTAFIEKSKPNFRGK